MPFCSVTYRIIVHQELLPSGDVEPLMAALSDAGLAPILEQFGSVMREYQKVNWVSQGGTFGSPWPALAPSTIADKLRKGYPIDPLVRTGDLRFSIGNQWELTANSITVGPSDPKAKYHDDPGPGSRVPQRILVALTDEEIDEMEDLLRTWFASRVGFNSAMAVEIQREVGTGMI